LALLRDLTAQGHSIGLVAALPIDALESMLEKGRMNPSASSNRPERIVRGGDTVAVMLEKCLRSTEQLDRQQLELDLGRASTMFALHELLDELIGPLMERVGNRWRTGELRPAQEHMATDAVRAFLSARRASYTPREDGPVIVVTTPSGQTHEIGALMVSLIARASGWNDIYLGPNLPADDIVAAVMKSRAKGLALSIVYPSEDGRIENELAFLRQQLPAGTRVFVGGRAADSYGDALQHMGAKLFHRLADFRETLEGHSAPHR
jgi:methylmalonyl-CoA mutase cobalamin-binding subunit